MLFFDHTVKDSQKQLVVPEDCVMQVIRALHNSPVQGHAGFEKCCMNCVKNSINLTLR